MFRYIIRQSTRYKFTPIKKYVPLYGLKLPSYNSYLYGTIPPTYVEYHDHNLHVYIDYNNEYNNNNNDDNNDDDNNDDDNDDNSLLYYFVALYLQNMIIMYNVIYLKFVKI